MEWLVESTATNLKIGPFLDIADGITPLTGLAGSMTVYLSRNGGAFAVRASVAAITHDRDGYYNVPLGAADVGVAGSRLRLEVTDEATHVPVWENYRVVTESEYNAAIGASGTLYATAAEVRAKKIAGETVDLSAYTNDDIETELNLVSRYVEEICNDIFYTKTETNKFDGSGTPRLFFHPRIPYRLISVTSAKEYDIDGSTLLDTYTEGTDFIVRDYWLEMAKDFPGDSPRRRYGSGGVWPKGQQNIWIEGTWGRSSCPPEIKRAAILWVLEYLMPGSTGQAPKDIVQVNWSDFTLSYKQGEDTTGLSTGFPEIDRLLHSHVNHVDMFQAVPDNKQTFDNRLIDG